MSFLVETQSDRIQIIPTREWTRRREPAAPFEGCVMVTTKSLRYFAADCRADALKAEDPSQRDVMVNVARTWAKTADVIERHVRGGTPPARKDNGG
jgi:hypothetical protein